MSINDEWILKCGIYHIMEILFGHYTNEILTYHNVDEP